LAFAPGEEAHVDLGEAPEIVNGRERLVQLFCIQMAHSRHAFVRVYERANMDRPPSKLTDERQVRVKIDTLPNSNSTRNDLVVKNQQSPTETIVLRHWKSHHPTCVPPGQSPKVWKNPYSIIVGTFEFFVI
jgi:hypothetical protein